MFEARRMASKLTVVCICATLITVSVIILIMESLSSPSQCRQNVEIKTENGRVGNPEPIPISTSTTGISNSTVHSFLVTTSALNVTSEVTPVGQSNYSSSTDFLTKREEENHDAVLSTQKPITVFSASKNGENIISRVPLPSISEENTEDSFVSDLPTQTGEAETVTPPENSSSVHSQTPSPGNRTRKIIFTPERNCRNGQKKDTLGTCRPIW